jgi:hypothetical protein
MPDAAMNTNVVTLPEPSVPKVYAALLRVMSLVAKEGIAKARSNQQQGFMFRGIDDVYNALASPLCEAGLLILPRVLERTCEARETKNGGILYSVVVEMEFSFVCAADGSRHIVRMFGEAMDSGDKATNKAMSAAFKYACMQAFCIPTEGENDADAVTHPETKPAAAAPRTQLPAKPTAAPPVVLVPAQDRATPEQQSRMRELIAAKNMTSAQAQQLAMQACGSSSGLNKTQADQFIAALEIFVA